MLGQPGRVGGRETGAVRRGRRFIAARLRLFGGTFEANRKQTPWAQVGVSFSRSTLLFKKSPESLLAISTFFRTQYNKQIADFFVYLFRPLNRLGDFRP
jgi:hypothetical protein